MGVRVGDSLFEGRVVKVHVTPMEAHVELFAAEVNGVSASFYGCLEGFPVASRGQQFNGFTVSCHRLGSPFSIDVFIKYINFRENNKGIALGN